MALVNYTIQPQFINYFFDPVTGAPLIGGTIEWFKATDHSTHKATYLTDVITPHATEPPEWDNPHTLDSVGSIGAIYYADDEPYYIEVRKSDTTLVKSIDNYPSSGDDAPVVTEFDPTNYFLNPQFRFHYKTAFDNDYLVAHPNDFDIAADHWVFRRNNTNAINTISFPEFIVGQTDVPENPKYYLRYNCTGVGGAGESYKDIALRITGVETLSGETVTISFFARSSTSSSIQVALIQHFGTGGSPSGNVETLTIESLGVNWARVTLTIVIPAINGKVLGTNNDDALYAGIRLPLNQVSTVDIANFQLNKGEELIEFNYKTYEMSAVEKKAIELPDLTNDDVGLPLIITSNKTIAVDTGIVGHIKLFAHNIRPYGYLSCDSSSYATFDTISETDDVVTYNRLYNKIGNIWGYGYKGTGSGNDGFRSLRMADTATNILVATNTFIGTVTNWADHDTGFTITTLNPGWLNGLGFILTFDNGTIIRCTNNANGNVTDASAGTSGFTITKIQDGGGSQPEIYTIAPLDFAGITAGTYFEISSTTDDYYVWFTKNNVGTDPAVGGRTGIRVDLSSLHPNRRDVTLLVAEALEGHHTTRIACNAASTLSGGESFFVENNVTSGLYVWYTIDGIGTDPVHSGRTGLKVALNGSDTAANVQQKTDSILSGAYFTVPDFNGAFVRMDSESSRQLDPDHGFRVLSSDFEKTVGSFQQDEFESHRHRVWGGSETSSSCYDIANGARCLGGPEHTTGLQFRDIFGTSGNKIIENTGGTESRPVNYNLVPFIKY